MGPLKVTPWDTADAPLYPLDLLAHWDPSNVHHECCLGNAFSAEFTPGLVIIIIIIRITII